MKINPAKKLNNEVKKVLRTKNIRSRLAFAFLLFALVLMGSLWILQTVFLETFYEIVAARKTEGVVKLLSSEYASSQDFNLTSYCNKLGEYSDDLDIYFYIEGSDQSFSITSTDFMSSGRFMTGSQHIVAAARERLAESGLPSISFTIGEKENKLLITAMQVQSPYRPEVNFFAVNRLKPLDSAVDILALQLFWVTVAALIIGLIIALWYSKKVAAPISKIRDQARQLGTGDYDVNFTGGSYVEINELADTLNETAEELKRADTLQKDLLANVSHDLRTPLTMIKSYAELIRDISGDDKERRDEHLEVIVDETDRLSELVGDILLLSRIQSGAETMEDEEFDIQEAASHVLATYKVLEENERFTFNFESLDGGVMVCGDERRIKQVFSNLISNAVRYSDETREITLRFSLERGDSRVRCECRDKGIGIEPEDLEKIWNRYQKASSTNTRVNTGGTGLGLSIAREILEHHGAEYGVDSVVGQGSVFWFTIPCKFIENN